MSAAEAIPCPTCGIGRMIPRKTDHSVRLPDGVTVTVPDIEIEVCDNCQETSISLESSLVVDAYLAEHNEQLSTTELREIRESLGVDQTEMADILGLGAKTYHRWEKGSQIPSRSMGYYLRLLAEFPNGFAWLRNRGWREKNKVIHVNFREKFPALGDDAEKYSQQAFSRNPARALFGKAICR